MAAADDHVVASHPINRVVAAHATYDVRTFGANHGFGARRAGHNGNLFHFRDLDGSSGSGFAPLPVGNGEGELGLTAEIFVGRESPGSVSIVGDAAVVTRIDGTDRECIAIDITGPGQQLCLGDDDRSVFVGRKILVLGDRPVVAAGHCDGDGALVGAALAVCDLVGERNVTCFANPKVLEAARRIEAVRAVRTDGDRPFVRRLGQAIGQGVTIDVAGGKVARHGAGVLGRVDCAVFGNGRIIDGGNLNDACGGGFASLAVGDSEGQLCLTVEVFVGRKGPSCVAIVSDGAVLARGYGADRKHVAINVGGSGKQLRLGDGDRRVFVGGKTLLGDEGIRTRDLTR